GHRIDVAGWKKPDERIIEVIAIDPGARSHDGYTDSHKFEDFRAECLIAEGIRALRHDTEVRLRHHFRDFPQPQRFVKYHAAVHAEHFRERNPGPFHRPITVNMKFGMWHTLLQFCECANGDIETLMGLQTTRKNNYRLMSLHTPCGSKNRPIDVIDENRAFAFRSSTRCIFLQPQVIRQNHVVCKPPTQFFHELQSPYP